ncbi:patatin-like phospholipase family protein [Aspergillus clavatus NRRL 1]|uniref:Phospholipase, patatin family protein n=1 Tax=Aspergillus clavatus (strain ATCC 1007 / CBS 513.65 / DSM 816 / NCTC 3887 / NRRL 1 / QM 1276 / 107) TaxID=344612 RepID=A1CF15_ASPCL|nr:phospholipase, patatin family protein [Aspergillus clavatus NRRL 1]EAW11464.1 phospholipase, patatin family protein [Aspergillus clavatus NRRL 1]
MQTGFRTDDVYDRLYQEHCLAAWEIHQDPHPGRHCDAVYKCLEQLAEQLGPRCSSVAIRREVLTAIGTRWPGICLPTVCCFCLTRSTEHMLPCRHAMCDTCVTILGSPSRSAEYHVDLSRCPWCQEGCDLTVRQLPPTKGAVVVALDGGGIRGLVTLGLLRALERRLDSAISIAEIADYIIGTSVGAFITADLVYNGTSVEEGYQKFPAFARKVFRPCRAASRLWPWLAAIVGILKDGYYDTNSLDHTLNVVLPPTLRLFDVLALVPTGTRVGVVASRASDGKPILFPNYRGVGSRSEKLPYEVVQVDGETQNPRLQDVVGCSVAAPWDLLAWGTLQDGGVRANNPMGIAQEECRMIWPSRRIHDLLVSVGTGYTPRTEDTGDPPGRQFPAGWGPVRLWRAYNSSPCMDGMEAYREGRVHVPPSLRSNTIRLDFALDGDLPRLDDVGKLEELAALPFTVPDELVRAVLASCFFFELDTPPSRADGQYRLHGSILCARTQSRRIVDRVLVEFPGARFCSGRDHSLGRVDNDNGCLFCGYYRKQVTLSVPSLDEEIMIALASPAQQRLIGGFPKTIRQLLHDQQAEAVFGRPDHQNDRWPPRRSCYCVKMTKRQVHFVEPAPQRKKRRL